MRSIAMLAVLLAGLAAACGDSSGNAATTGAESPASATQPARSEVRGAAVASSSGNNASANARSSSSSSASASSGSSKGSLELTGAVSGSVNLTSAACASAGTRSISLNGVLAGVSFGLKVNAQASGDFAYGPNTQQGSLPVVELTDQSPTAGAKTWSAGTALSPGSGSLTINSDNSGSIDLDLKGTGASGIVHVRGAWTC